jgi:hypothetical protein
MINDIQLLKSVSQFIDIKGNIYEMSTNGNIDDMVNQPVGNIISAPQTWWNHLSAYDIRIADIIFGGLVEKGMYG